MASAAIKRTQFRVKTSDRSLGFDSIQKLGRALALPMFLMGLMGIAAGLGLGIARASEISDGGAADTIETLRHVQQGATFIGLALLLAGISFAIARILGRFRADGGYVQESAGRRVLTLERPLTAWAFLGLMMMGMMVVLAAAVIHFIFAADVESTRASLAESADRFAVLAGVERLGIGMYLASIALGLATIIQVLRFQARRVRQLPKEERSH